MAHDLIPMRRLEPCDTPVAAEPCHLALGIAACVAFDEFHGLLAGDLAVEVVEHSPAPDQYDPEANEESGSIFDEMMGEYNDFEGDDNYDDEY